MLLKFGFKIGIWNEYCFFSQSNIALCKVADFKGRFVAVLLRETSTKLIKQFASSLWINSLENQLVSSPLRTYNSPVTIKPEILLILISACWPPGNKR